jgi:uncharacterized protein YqjF (DUF2071 family)
MFHRWSQITFIHWRCPAAVLQAMLPPGLAVETMDGSAWVGLTPFRMEHVRPPLLPWLSRFPETNVRTSSGTATAAVASGRVAPAATCPTS